MPNSRRPVAWCDFLMNFTSVATTVNLDNLLVNQPASDTITVTRILGDFIALPSPTQEVESAVTVDVGIGVINKEAFDLGTGVGIPNPTVEDSYPPRGWLYVARKPVMLTVPGGGSPAGIFVQPAHFKFDLRGQRKVDKGVLFMWIEQNNDIASMTLRFNGRIRVLSKA